MKKILISIVAVALIMPQVAMATWWNPFTWKMFNKSAEVRVEQSHDVSAESKKEKVTATSTALEIENLQKRIDDLKKQEATAVPSIKKAEKTTSVVAKSSKPAQLTTVKLSNLGSFIESAIASYKSNITYANQIIEAVDFYESNLQKGRSIALDAMNNETEPYYKRAWEIIIEMVDDSLKYYGEVRNACLGNVRQMEDSITTLQKEQERNLLSEPVTVEEYWAYYNKLEKFITVEQIKKNLSDGYNVFEPYAKRKQSEISAGMIKVIDLALAYHKSNLDAYNQILSVSKQVNTYQPTYNYYQPVVYPVVQMPQTTRCTISGDGVGIQAYVNCSTSSF